MGAAVTAALGVSASDQAPAIHAASGTPISSTTTGTTTAVDEYLVGACVVGNVISGAATAQWNLLGQTNFGGNVFYDGISVRNETIQLTQSQNPSGTYGC